MARVVVATAFGGPEVLAILDEDVGGPGPDEVRIVVRAAGINPVDWKRYGGAVGSAAAFRCALVSRRLATSWSRRERDRSGRAGQGG
jgi:NADPH:quinone reductase-like Zn-dependent oxidoreductase